MIVTDTLMAPGGWECQLRNDSRYLKRLTPDGFIVVFDAPPKEPLLSRARYTGRVLEVDGTVLRGEGLASLLAQTNGYGVVADTPVSRSAQSLSAWFADLFPVNSVTVGFVSGGSNWAGVWQVGQSLREFLADLMRGVGGGEWRINPDGTIDASGTAGSLFRSDRLVFTPTAETSTGAPRGVVGQVVGALRSNSSRASRVVVAGQGEGDQMLVVSQSTGATITGLDGSGLEMTAVVDAPQQDATGAAAVALLQAGLRAQTRFTFDVESDDVDLWRLMAPGDSVLVFDPESGVEDRNNPVPFGGRIIYPVSVRVHTMSGPFPSWSSVWLFDRGAWQDISDDVVWRSSGLLLRVGSGSGPVDFVSQGSPAWLGEPEVVNAPRVVDTRDRREGRVADSRDRRAR